MKTIEEILSKLPEDIREPITEAFQIFKNDLMLKELKYLREDINELRKIVIELAEAQNRTEERLNQLAEAQNRTETELRKLTVEHRKTRENLGGLAHAFGHLLEDRAIKSLPKILKINYGMEVIEDFKRDYLKVGEEYIELNIYGKVMKNGKEYYVIAEAKSRLSKKFIDDFIKKCDRIFKNSFKIIISYLFPPLIKQYAQEKGIILISSYELEL